MGYLSSSGEYRQGASNNSFSKISKSSYNLITEDSYSFSNITWASLEDSEEVVRTVYPVSTSPATLSTSSEGMRVSWDVTNTYPTLNTERYEIRQTDITLVPTLGTTEYWRYEFIWHNYPSASAQVHAPFTVMQLFDHGLGNPRFSVTVTGETQYSGTYNRDILTDVQELNEVVHAGTYLNLGTNVIEAVRYYDNSVGYVGFILNGSLLRTVSNINTSPNGDGHGLQFGMYPYGFQREPTARADQVNTGEVNFEFTMVSYLKQIYDGAVPVFIFL